MSTFRVLDQLEAILRRSLRIPLTGIILIDGERLLSILERVRISLPEELRQARYLTQENHRILREAQTKAEAIVATASEEAARRVEQSDIMKIAREQAEELNRRANQQAVEMREGVQAYARGILGALESELDRLTAVVRQSASKLEKTTSAPAAPPVSENIVSATRR